MAAEILIILCVVQKANPDRELLLSRHCAISLLVYMNTFMSTNAARPAISPDKQQKHWPTFPTHCSVIFCRALKLLEPVQLWCRPEGGGGKTRFFLVYFLSSCLAFFCDVA